MKELSIEQKARAYDEAIERAKKEKEKSRNLGLLEFIEKVFPELAESKDERIRKEIIDFLELPHPQFVWKRDHEKWIAWLEKLGNINPTEDELEALRMAAYEPTKNWSEKLQSLYEKLIHCERGEQKPIEEYNITGIKSRHTQGKLGEMIKNLKPVNEVLEQKSADNQFTPEQAGVLDKHIDKFLEQNPWSEEDEKYTNIVLAALYSPSAEGLYSFHNVKSNDVTNWFISLKDRVQPQPKREWSKEDERNISKIIEIFHYIEKTSSIEPISLYSNEINWLKSLKERYTWKQSDEHYELEEFAKIVRCNLTGISKAVQELFEAKYLQLTGNKMYEGFKD